MTQLLRCLLLWWRMLISPFLLVARLYGPRPAARALPQPLLPPLTLSPLTLLLLLPATRRRTRALSGAAL